MQLLAMLLITVSKCEIEVIDHGLAALRPLNQELVVESPVLEWEVACVHGEKHERDVDED